MSTVYAGYRLADDYKEHRSGRYKARTLKKGRSVFGEFRIYPDGMTVYFAARVHGEQVYTRDGAWALDRALDFFLKTLRPKFIGIAVSRDNKTRSISPKKVAIYYLMRMEDYFKHRREEDWDFSTHAGAKGKRGSRQYLIDIMFMNVKSMMTEDETIRLKLAVPTK